MNEVKTLGIAGGGQLGRMLTEAAHALGLRVVVLDPLSNGPAGQIADAQIVGSFENADALRALSEKANVLTFEIESANAEALADIEHAKPGSVHPTPGTLTLIRDKLAQKRFLAAHDIPVGPFADADTLEEGVNAGERFGYPFVLKARSGGFDGRGNRTVRSSGELPEAFQVLGGKNIYAEAWVPFVKELAVVAVRNQAGEILVYPVVETIQKNHICHEVLAPASVSHEVRAEAEALAKRVLEAFHGAGVFGIEMFLNATGEVLINEVAPRVHNSGHFTIEANETSQFENHVRAVMNLPLGSVAMKAPFAVMVNIIGDRTGPATPIGVAEAEALGAFVHIYGKAETKPERKMGHITALGATLEEAKAKAEHARALISI